MEEGVQFALECVLAAGLNEALMKETLNFLSSVCVSQSLSAFPLSPLVSAPSPLSLGLSWLSSYGPLISVKGFGALKCLCFRCQEPLSSSSLV